MLTMLVKTALMVTLLGQAHGKEMAAVENAAVEADTQAITTPAIDVAGRCSKDSVGMLEISPQLQTCAIPRQMDADATSQDGVEADDQRAASAEAKVTDSKRGLVSRCMAKIVATLEIIQRKARTLLAEARNLMSQLKERAGKEGISAAKTAQRA